MGSAAREEAAGGQAARAARIDPVILERVRAALLRQLGGRLPALPACHPPGVQDVRLPRRTTR